MNNGMAMGMNNVMAMQQPMGMGMQPNGMMM